MIKHAFIYKFSFSYIYIYVKALRKYTRQFNDKSQIIKNDRCRVLGAKLSTKLAKRMANRNCQEQRSIRAENIFPLPFSFSFVDVSFFSCSFSPSFFILSFLSPCLPLSFFLFLIHFLNFPLFHVFFPSSLLPLSPLSLFCCGCLSIVPTL